jgi:hypothetical protein
MKGDALVIFVLIVFFGLVSAAVGAPVILGALNIIAGWLAALPGPTEQWATILSALAWPLAALVILLWQRAPIALAAGKLANRFERDDLEIAGFLKVTNSRFTNLAEHAIQQGAGPTETEDIRIVKSLLEFAAESDANAGRLRDWISAEFGPTSEPEAFLSEARYAEARKRAKKALIGE